MFNIVQHHVAGEIALTVYSANGKTESKIKLKMVGKNLVQINFSETG